MGTLSLLQPPSGLMQLQEELKQKQARERKDTAGEDVGDNWSGGASGGRESHRQQVEAGGGPIKEPRKQEDLRVFTQALDTSAQPTSTSQRMDSGSWKLSLSTPGSGS